MRPTVRIPPETMAELIYGDTPANDTSLPELLDEFEGPEVVGEDSVDEYEYTDADGVVRTGVRS